MDTDTPVAEVAPKEVRNRGAQINFRISDEDMASLKQIAKEMDFPYSVLARRVVKQFIKKHLETKESLP